MEIEIGEYVRTKNGEIRKVVEYVVGGYLVDTSYYNEVIKENTLGIIPLEDVKKHTKNIIDLLEEGDFVNGIMIEEFADYEEGIYLGVPIYTDALMNTIEEVRPLDSIEIETILTKEQYMNNCYVVEG